MKKILFSLLVLIYVAANVAAQNTYPADPFVASKEGWEVDLEKAYNLSKKTGKPILANFTGVKWCGWCVRLDNDVFSKDEFRVWAKKNVILLELDYPRRYQLPEKIQAQNASLQQAFGVRGFPTIWLFDIDRDSGGKYTIDAHGKTGYAKSVGEFISAIDQMMVKRANDVKAKSGK